MLARNFFLAVGQQARQQAVSVASAPSIGKVASSSRLVLPRRALSSSQPWRQEQGTEEKKIVDAAAKVDEQPPVASSEKLSAAQSRRDELWGSVIEAFDSGYRQEEAPKPARGEHKRGSPEARAAEREARFEDQWQKRTVQGAHLPGGTPSAGRTVEVKSDHGSPSQASAASNVEGGDLARAYAIMMGTLRRNNIRRELALTQRFEKPNQERRRKRSERHRRRFADLVRKKVQLVSQRFI